MSDQAPGNPNNNNSRPPASGGGGNNNNRRHHNQNNQNQRRPNTNQGPSQQNAGPGNTNPNPHPNPNTRRRHGRNHSNRPRNPNAQTHTNAAQNNGPMGINIERIYEKYLNLLDQHIIARRKYHDLFYRAEPSQKNKLERNFYNTLHDIREFENKLAPEARELFEKRNNGLRPDNIYTTNHEMADIGDTPPPETEWNDPHFLRSQQLAQFAEDKEESMGSIDDYLKYKNLA
jgi:hypothetical protein